jgi:DNA-binding NarL/FixJ family response regulator
MQKTIIIAEDHAFTAEGMQQSLQALTNLNILEVAKNGIEAISAIKKHKPDCVLLDLSMPGANGIEVFTEARRWSPKTRIAIITGFPSPSIFKQLIDAGIEGLFLKNSSTYEICQGMEKIANGERVITKSILEMLSNHKQISNLTAREIEVLQSIARGLSNNKIAEQLGISPKTIDSHRTSLMKKLSVNSTATLLVRAMREGLINV